MNKLSRVQWEELEQQMSITPSEVDPEGVPGEHIKLIAMLNRFGFRVPCPSRKRCDWQWSYLIMDGKNHNVCFSETIL